MVAKTSAKAAAASKNGKSKASAANAAPPAKHSDPPEIDQVTSGDSTISEQSEGHDTNSLATDSVCDTSADGSKIYKSIASDKDAADNKKCGEILTSEEDQNKKEKAEKKVHVKEELKQGEDAVADEQEEGYGNKENAGEEEPQSNGQEEDEQCDDNEEDEGECDDEEVNKDQVNDERENEEEGDDEEEEEEEEECEEYEEEEEEEDEEEEEEEEETSTLTSRRSMRGRPSSCVFVASLSAMHSDDHLCNSVNNHFRQWGEITLVKVLRDQVNRPYAFVQYTNDRDAANALAGAQHNTLDGRTIRCEPARVNRTLFVTPLSDDLADESTVGEFLGQYGELEGLVYSNIAPADIKKSHSWFAKFAYRDDAIRAYANWSAEWAQNLEGPNDNRGTIDKQSIFIGQLDSEVTKEKLIERFSRHGTVIDCNLIIRHPDPSKNIDPNSTNRNYSFAFIKFEQEEAAAEAVEQENHTIFMDKTIHVQYRELYHNQSSRHFTEPKLALAPPPINLPSKQPVGGGIGSHQRVPVRHHSYPMTPMPQFPQGSSYTKKTPPHGNKSPQAPQQQRWRSPSMYTRGPSNYRGGGDDLGRGGYYSPSQQHTANGEGSSSPYRNSPSSNASSSPNSQRTFSNWGSSNSSSRKTSYESNTYTPPNKRNPSNNYNKPPPPPPAHTTSYDSNQKPFANTKGGYSATNNGGMRKGKGALSIPPPQKPPQQRDSSPVGKKPTLVSGNISKPAPAARSGPRPTANEERGNDNRPTGRFNNNDKARNGTKFGTKSGGPKPEDGGGKTKNNSRDVQVRPDQNFVPRGMMAPTDGSGQPLAYYPLEGYYSMPVMGSYPYGPGYFPGGVQFQPMSDGFVGWQPGPVYYGYYNQEMPDENDDDDDDDDDDDNKAKKESGDEEQED